jgi:ribosomal protein S18 acetylase RimI-like enzyme
VAALELRPFADDDVEAAGRLLAERHRRHRNVEPLLSERFEDPAVAAAEVERAWTSEDAAGAAAFRDGRLVGYLIGAPDPDARWGTNEWIQVGGHAAEDAETVRDLYAAVASGWLKLGRGRHYVVVPATDKELVDAWFRLSFGQMQAYGICKVPARPWPTGVRAAGPRDVEALLELVPLLGAHQRLAPVFSGQPDLYEAGELRAELEQDITSDEIGLLVAEDDGRVVGAFEVTPVELSDMHRSLARPERACFLSFAATLPDVRGSGHGLALTDAAFAWAHAAGYATMVTDWRVTNLLSSRFWPRRGFGTTFLRLYRSIP